MSYDTLEDTLLQANKFGMEPQKQIELVDFWASGAIEASGQEFTEDDWEKRQSFAGFVKDQATKAKTDLLKSVTENKLNTHFGEDAESKKKFIDEVLANGEEYSRYTPEFKPLATDFFKTVGDVRMPTQNSISGAVDDGKGNKLVEFAASLNSSGNADYATVFVNGKDGVQKGDVITFPKGFDGYQYKLEKLKKRVNDAAELQANRGSLPDGFDSMPDEIYEKEKAELDAFLGLSDAEKRKETTKGANLYISDYIIGKAKEGDPRYADVGQDFWEGLAQSAQNVIPTAYHNARSGIATLLLGDSVPRAIGEAASGNLGLGVLSYFGGNPLPATPLASAVEKAASVGQDQVEPQLEAVIENSVTANNAIRARETFSRLAVTSPAAASVLDTVSDTVTQGIAQAAEFALLRGGGLAAAGVKAAGATTEELTAKAETLRAQGDTESADWIDRNKYAVARRAGLYEGLIEKISLGHDPFRSLKNVPNPRAAVTEYMKDLLGEAGEEAMVQGLGSVDQFLNAVTTEEEFKESMLQIPEASLLGAVGVAIPAGARAVVGGILSKSHKNVASTLAPMRQIGIGEQAVQQASVTESAANQAAAEAGAPNPVPSVAPPAPQPTSPFTIAAAENDEENIAASKNLADAVNGTPGDAGNVDIVSKKRTPAKHRRSRQHAEYLTTIAGITESSVRSSTDSAGRNEVALTFTNNRQEQQIPDDADVFITFDPLAPPDYNEAEFSKHIAGALLNEEWFAALPAKEQEAELKKFTFDYYPPFREMNRRGSVIGDQTGATRFIDDFSLLKLIEKGKVDPSKTYWYHDTTTGRSAEYQALEELFPENRKIIKNSKLGIKRNSGKYVQSKAVEQQALTKTKYGLSTVTVGGKIAFPGTDIAESDDIVDGKEIQVETRNGKVLELTDEIMKPKEKAVNGLFIKKDSEAALIASLDKKFGKDQWVMKLDQGAQRMGLIMPWIPGVLNEDRTRFNRDIPAMKKSMYVAQQRVDANKEFRINFRVSQDGTPQVIPFGIHGGAQRAVRINDGPFTASIESVEGDRDKTNSHMLPSWGPIGLPVVSKQFKTSVTEMLNNLRESLPDYMTPGTVYGVDVLVDQSGLLKIIELNPTDEEGISGGVTQYGSATNGMVSLARNGFVPEAMAAYAGYMRAQGSNEIADRILKEAIQKLGASQGSEFNDVADDLYNKGMLFSQEGSSLPVASGEYHFVNDTIPFQENGNTYVQTILMSLIDTVFPVTPFYRKLAEDLNDFASKSFNPGLQALVQKSSTPVRSTYYRSDNSIVLNKTAQLDTVLHEILHALTANKLDPRIDQKVILLKNTKLTGAEYLTVLENYINDETADPVQKAIAANYIAAVDGLGLSDTVFGKHLVSSNEISSTIGDIPYALTSIHEFMAEISNPKFRAQLMGIPIEHSVERHYLRQLLNSVLEWMKSILFKQGSPSMSLFDKTYADLMAFIAHDSQPLSKWEKKGYSRGAASTENVRPAPVIQKPSRPTKKVTKKFGLFSESHSVITKKQAKTIQRFHDAAQKVLGMTSYGMRKEKVGDSNIRFRWSNGVAKWIAVPFDRKSAMDENGEYNLDADQFLAKFSSIKEASQVASFLPPLPLFQGSFEQGGMLKRMGAEIPKNSKAYKDLTDMLGEGALDMKSEELSPYLDRFIDEINKTNNPDSVTDANALNAETINPPYTNKRVQKGYKSDDSDEIVPLFDIYEIDMPGTKFHQSTITVPVGTDHDGLVAYINKKYKDAGNELYGPPQKENIRGTKFDPSLLPARMQAEVEEVKLLIKQKAPSEVIEATLAKLKNAADFNEFQLLKEAYPGAFDKKTNDEWKEYTNLADAENKLVDWLLANPKDAESKIDKEQLSAKRLKLAKAFTSQLKDMKKRLEKNKLPEYDKHHDEVKKQVNRAIDWLLNIQDPSLLTDRQLTAINKALETFLDSDGYNVRGFAKMASMLYTNQEADRLTNLKQSLEAQGINQPFGDPIVDWRRNFGPSKTGSSVADFASEMLAIFNRPETRRIFASIFARYRAGINAYKAMREDMKRDYSARIRAVGNTTQLEDHRIGAVLFMTQYEQNGSDPMAQLLNRAAQLEKSIERKESSSNKFDKREAPIDRQAFEDIVRPYLSSAQAGVIDYDDFIQAMESTLSPKEFALTEIARKPGRDYYSIMDGINQIARGEPIQNWKNYFKQVQYKQNGEQMVNHWGEKALQTADSILQPREGLGQGSVFSLNWRSAFDWQLDETAYEFNTGIDRVMLFDFLKDRRFDEAMDGTDTTRPRAFRIRSQIGGVHANIKNKEIEFGAITGLAMEATKILIANKLVSLKAIANQLIPFFNFALNHPATMSSVVYHGMTSPSNRQLLNNQINKVPDLKNRIQQWDTLIDTFRVQDRTKSTGMTKGFEKAMEAAYIRLAQFADATRTAVRSPYVGGAMITLTNGLSEVFAAKNVFMGLYIKSLVQRGIISNADEWFNNPVDDEVSMSEAQLEFDSFVLGPTGTEFRSEFAQRNSGAKIAFNLMFTGLLRTATQQSIKSVTGIRDLMNAQIAVATNPNRANLDFLNDAAREVEKQFTNIVLYYAIAQLAHYGLGSLFTASSFVIDAVISNDKEDKDKWMRRLRNLERMNRDSALQFQAAQAKTDILFGSVPMPAVFQSNPAREMFSSFFKAEHLHDGTVEQIDEELKLMRKKRDDIKKIIKDQRKLGIMDEPQFQRYNSALEFAEYAVGQLETQRDNKVNFGKSVAANTIKSMTPLPNENDLARLSDAYMPDWLEDSLFSQPEKVDKSEEVMKKARVGYGYWPLAAYLSISGPSFKAAKTTLKEYSSDQIEKEERAKKQAELILQTLGQ